MEDLTKIQRNIIDNIKEFRQNKFTPPLSQGKLADKADIGRGYLTEIETGKSIPSLKTLIKIANALEVKVYQLFIDSKDTEDYNKEDLLHRVYKKLKKNIISELDNTIDSFKD